MGVCGVVVQLSSSSAHTFRWWWPKPYPNTISEDAKLGIAPSGCTYVNAAAAAAYTYLIPASSDVVGCWYLINSDG